MFFSLGAQKFNHQMIEETEMNKLCFMVYKILIHKKQYWKRNQKTLFMAIPNTLEFLKVSVIFRGCYLFFLCAKNNVSVFLQNVMAKTIPAIHINLLKLNFILKCTQEEQNGTGVGGHGVRPSLWIHQEYTVRCKYMENTS